MEDISGFGIVLTVIASNTFPAGVQISQFADDSDPFDVPELTIADKAMGINGDLIVWSKPAPIEIKVGVIAGSNDDDNLAALMEANRVGRGKVSAQDVITLAAAYPDGTSLSLTPGKMTQGMPAPSVASSGRLKTKVYSFSFENRTTT